MATVINNPTSESSNGMGFLIGTIVLAGVVAVLIYYGIPAFQNMNNPIQVNVESPEINVPAPEVTVETTIPESNPSE